MRYRQDVVAVIRLHRLDQVAFRVIEMDLNPDTMSASDEHRARCRGQRTPSLALDVQYPDAGALRRYKPHFSTKSYSNEDVPADACKLRIATDTPLRRVDCDVCLLSTEKTL